MTDNVQITDQTPTYCNFKADNKDYRFHEYVNKKILIEVQNPNQGWDTVGEVENEAAILKYINLVQNKIPGLPDNLKNMLLNALLSKQTIPNKQKINRVPSLMNSLIDRSKQLNKK